MGGAEGSVEELQSVDFILGAMGPIIHSGGRSPAGMPLIVGEHSIVSLSNTRRGPFTAPQPRCVRPEAQKPPS